MLHTRLAPPCRLPEGQQSDGVVSGGRGGGTPQTEDQPGLLDARIVALDSEGHPSLQALQHRTRPTGNVLVFYAFDLLQLEDVEPDARSVVQATDGAQPCRRHSSFTPFRGKHLDERRILRRVELRLLGFRRKCLTDQPESTLSRPNHHQVTTRTITGSSRPTSSNT